MIVSGTFVSNGGGVNVDIGFVPDYVELYSALGGTELGFKYFKCLADAATSGQYGLLIGNDGAISANATAAAGIAAYDTASNKVMLPAPNGSGLVEATLGADFVAGAAQPTARSVSVVGTVVKPSVHNSFVYECTVSGGVYGTEPTWPTVPGTTVSDGTNTWICREEKTARSGGKGFTVGADLATDGEIWVFKAEQHDRQSDMGDADATNPVKF